MRTFHIGVAQRGAEQSSVEASLEGTVRINNRNVVNNSDGVMVVMSRSTEVMLFDDQGRERGRHRIPYGSKLLVDEGDRTEIGQKMAEWDPYTILILTEKEGVAHYVDLVEGVSMREVTDEATGIASRWSSTGSSRPGVTI